MLDNDRMVLPGFVWGKPCFFNGPLTDEVRQPRIETACRLKKDAVGTAVYSDRGKLLLLSITSDGAGSAFAIGPDGVYHGEEGEVQLQTASAVRRWTTLAMKDAKTLLGAADGQVLEMARDGKNWRETRRWSSWAEGPANKFGDTITLTADAGRLWVSDCRRHRVLVFALDSGKLEADFGAVDQPARTCCGSRLPNKSPPEATAPWSSTPAISVWSNFNSLRPQPPFRRQHHDECHPRPASIRRPPGL